MIIQFNPTKLTRQPFFMELVNYLFVNQPVSLRDIKRNFPNQSHIEKSIEEFVKAGFIKRFERRYSMLIPLVKDIDSIELDQLIFIDDSTNLYSQLCQLSYVTELGNSTNELLIVESTDFARHKSTVANYFHKLKYKDCLSDEQQVLYNLLGDVNPEYFLKHVTTFLLKFLRKDEVLQKRRNIFVDSLEILGYVGQVEPGRYRLNMTIDVDSLKFIAKKD